MTTIKIISKQQTLDDLQDRRRATTPICRRPTRSSSNNKTRSADRKTGSYKIDNHKTWRPQVLAATSLAATSLAATRLTTTRPAATRTGGHKFGGHRTDGHKTGGHKIGDHKYKRPQDLAATSLTATRLAATRTGGHKSCGHRTDGHKTGNQKTGGHQTGGFNKAASRKAASPTRRPLDGGLNNNNRWP